MIINNKNIFFDNRKEIMPDANDIYKNYFPLYYPEYDAIFFQWKNNANLYTLKYISPLEELKIYTELFNLP